MVDAALRERLSKRLLWKVPAILLLVSFAVWWQWRQEEKSRPIPAVSPAELARLAGAVSGVWRGEVTYAGGDKFLERFFFQVEGERLFGTATFRGFKRAIEDGKIENDQISFNLRYEEMLGNDIRGGRNYYTVRPTGSDLLLSLRDDRESPPLEIKLSKSREED